MQPRLYWGQAVLCLALSCLAYVSLKWAICPKFPQPGPQHKERDQVLASPEHPSLGIGSSQPGPNPPCRAIGALAP